jgi:transposase
MMEQERSFKGEDAVRFLRHLLRQVPGKLLVIWDGSPIHRSRAVKDFLASGAASRVQLEQLPGYAPDLNPDEGVWKHLKCVELKNLCCQHLAELKIELRKAEERLRRKRDVISGLHQAAGIRGLDVCADISNRSTVVQAIVLEVIQPEEHSPHWPRPASPSPRTPLRATPPPTRVPLATCVRRHALPVGRGERGQQPPEPCPPQSGQLTPAASASASA